MDPNETLRLLISAINSGNRKRATGHARDLRAWVARSGFEPDNPNWNAYVRQALY